MLFFAGSETAELTATELRNLLFQALDHFGPRKRVLAVPPDFTRVHSRAGELTRYAYDYYRYSLAAVLPATGTHAPMTAAEIRSMFSDMPLNLFHVHDWRESVVTLGEVPADFIREQSEGLLDYLWPVQVNRLIVDPRFDLILSIGQVVPHEVSGMANYNKNLLIGTGGPEAIHRSHFLGAVYGMERIMGQTDTPVRRVLNYAADRFLRDVPVLYVLSVVAKNASGALVTRGLVIGDDIDSFQQAAHLSRKVNFMSMDRHIQKAVVFLHPDEYKSTWLGNKAIYRTRMALADDAELIVLAPGVQAFGEDVVIDNLIRRYGYAGTPNTLASVQQDAELAANLGAAAHLIHGSSEARFAITYCPGKLSKEEVESVGYRFADLSKMMTRYNPLQLSDGYNIVDGEEIFFVSNPGLGLWAHSQRIQ